MTVEGRRLRDEGMALVDSHAHPAWKALFDRELERLAASGRRFTVADITAVVGLPERRNAVGARIGAASKRHLIVQVGWEKPERASRHANDNRVWVGTDRAGGAAVSLPPRVAPPAPKPVVLGAFWRCGGCNSLLDPQTVTESTFDARYGEGYCMTCKTRVGAMRSPR